jgi:hypothetical protein
MAEKALLLHLVSELRYIAGISNGQVSRVAHAALLKINEFSGVGGFDVVRYRPDSQRGGMEVHDEGLFVKYEDYKVMIEMAGHSDTGVSRSDVPETISAQDYLIGEYPLPRSGGFGQARYGISVTHVPSGLVEKCDEARSQHKNRAIAFERLQVTVKAFYNNAQGNGALECVEKTGADAVEDALKEIYTVLSSHPEFQKGNSKVHYAALKAKSVMKSVCEADEKNNRDADLTDSLLDDVRMGMGLAPHNTPSNFCAGDGYF